MRFIIFDYFLKSRGYISLRDMYMTAVPVMGVKVVKHV